MRLILAAAAAAVIATPGLAQVQNQTESPKAALAAPSEQALANATEGTGQIKSVDRNAGTITLHQGASAALSSPARTVTYKASPEALRTAKPGDTVKFMLKTPDKVLVAIEPQ